jgi:hypothetical protein
VDAAARAHAARRGPVGLARLVDAARRPEEEAQFREQEAQRLRPQVDRAAPHEVAPRRQPAHPVRMS